MRTIHKTVLEVTDEQDIEIPEISVVLHLGVQKGLIYLWYLCDPETPKVKRKVTCRGTGHPIENIGKLGTYIGTVMLSNGDLVFHYFMGGE